jgi:hypothetical protein
MIAHIYIHSNVPSTPPAQPPILRDEVPVEATMAPWVREVRSMSWIQTFTGKQFWPLTPRVEDVDVRDIAHSLSLQCRFNGHCRLFYSVAEHSVRVSRAVSTGMAPWGLLHDAAEAYLTDLPRPVKARLTEFQGLEERLLEVIARAFGLPWPMPAAVQEADDVLLATEARDLMAPPPCSWELSAEPLLERIVPVSAERAEELFLARYRELWAGSGALG